MTDAPGSYFVVSRGGKDFVMYAREDAPALWRMIARFEDHSRAVDYADTENELLDDIYGDGGFRDDVKADVPEVVVPPSAITPANLAPRDPVQTGENYSEIIPASDPVEKINTGQQASDETRPEPEAAPAVAPDPEPEATQPEPVEPATNSCRLPDIAIPITEPETEQEALDRALAPVVEKLAEVTSETAVDDLKPISGAARLYYEYLCGVADRGETLPANILATAGPSGVKRGSIHYAKGALEMRGYISPLKMPGGAWGYRLLDGRTVESGPADAATGPGKHPNSRGNNTIGDAAAEKIDEKLQAGEPIRKIAKDVGVSKTSVQLRKQKPTAPVERGIMDAMEDEDSDDWAADTEREALTATQVKARLEALRKPVAVKQNPFGDRKPSAPPVDPDLLSQPIAWLTARGYAVEELTPTQFVIDGKTMTVRQLMGMANSDRVKAGQPLFPNPQLDPPSHGGSSLGQAMSGGAD